MTRHLTATMIAAALLSASTALVASVDVAEAQSSSRRVCTQEYDPVCGRKGTSYRTFANACEAQVSGYFVAAKGVCEGDRDRNRNEVRETCEQGTKPVCGIDGSRRKSFGNACEAQRAGYRILHNGRC